MPTKKGDFSKKTRSNSLKAKRSKPTNFSINVKGDVKGVNIIHGEGNVIDQSATSSQQLFIYGLLVVVAVLVIGWLAYYNLLRYDRTIASGQLNVVVIPFVEEKSWGYVKSDLGWSVAQILAEGTQSAFVNSGSALDVKILGPADRVPPMLYRFTEEQLNQEAENISEELNAQIIIYGVIVEDEYSDSIVTTKIYISPTNFGEAQELISDSIMGELSLGSIRLTGDTVDAADLLAQNKELRDRLEIFSSIINFLGAYLGEDFERADNYIVQAENKSLWASTDGLEVIYLIHGNMEIRRTRTLLVEKNLLEALETIARAKELFILANETSITNGNGTYARAYLGLAGAESLSAIAEFNVTGDRELIDTEALDRVIEYLDMAVLAEYQPETADIEVKVFYSMAQINLAYFVKTSDTSYLNKAKEYYQLIVDEYSRNKNARISEYAALSYSGLGHIAFQNGEFEDSANYFLKAQSLTVNPSLKAQLLARVGDAYYSMGGFENALKYYQEALNRRSDLEKAVSETRILQIEERVAELLKILEGGEK